MIMATLVPTLPVGLAICLGARVSSTQQPLETVSEYWHSRDRPPGPKGRGMVLKSFVMCCGFASDREGGLPLGCN